MKPSSLSRRTFLRGAGVSLSLPLLDAMQPRGVFAQTGTPPRRMVAINIPLGFYGPSFFPEQAGRDYATSDYLQSAEPMRNDFTIFSGTSHPDVDGGHSAEKSFLTAAPHPGSRSFKNTISLDQLVAREIGRQTRFASLTLGDHSLSWSANGVSIPSERTPAKAYAQLFLSGSREEIAVQEQRLQDGQSIMDTVLADAQAMQRHIGPADRQKLDQYFTAVRETEQRLVKAEAWAKTPKPVVEAESPGLIPGADFTARLKGHFDVIRLALQTDSTRVVTLGGNGGSEVSPLPGVDQGYHGLSHHGKNPEMIAQLERIEQETIRVWAEFLASLKATPDGSSNLLDQTQVLLGSNLGSGSGHLTTNLPIVLAGGPFRHGQHLAFDNRHNYPLPNLFVSMLQGLGLEYDAFASGKTTMRGLEMRG
ncbi:DUF1552 domain-containing protein [Lignipirellula cremea]|uniref:DUF1552 domain-containing protein n=1 Tax=Lignipirellula cremea TaxID=2528010 RepID=A0A518DUH8_9BACT|nr:DUF1552 domain-containing protein [Lignipirellula cremea]QDU95478.1 hypothetical protein Pla8534_32930 [Lignipirellula cremea]